ncbi:MAG TPA: flagellar protein FlgN [Syntrophales bacterium]|nr:flagellar protein FlgN [Syntrophales bacterium]
MNGLSLDDAGQRKRFLEVLPLLIANLRDELRRIEALHACLLREREILCGGSPQVLAQSNSDKEQALLDLEATRSLRSPLLTELSDLSGIPSDQMSVRMLASLAPPLARRELTTLGQALRKLAEAIRTLNDRNRGLIENSRQHVKSWLTFLLGAATTAPCYANSGDIPQAGIKGRFFRTEG